MFKCSLPLILVQYYITINHDSTLQTNACSYMQVKQQTVKNKNGLKPWLAEQARFQPVFVLDCLLLYPHVGAGIRLECRITVNSDIMIGIDRHGELIRHVLTMQVLGDICGNLFFCSSSNWSVLFPTGGVLWALHHNITWLQQMIEDIVFTVLTANGMRWQ